MGLRWRLKDDLITKLTSLTKTLVKEPKNFDKLNMDELYGLIRLGEPDFKLYISTAMEKDDGKKTDI